MPELRQHHRLPRNFHNSTFKPERQYIHAMLRSAASGRQGDYQDRAAATGIPMGCRVARFRPYWTTAAGWT